MYGFDDTEFGLSLINTGLKREYEEGRPLQFEVSGRPKIRVLSFDPLAYEKYGLMRNRGPQISGALALRTLLSAEHPLGYGKIIYAGVESGRQGYGFEMDPNNPIMVLTLNGIVSRLGLDSVMRLNPA